MLNREAVAAEMLRCAFSWEMDARLIGNLTAAEIASVAAASLTQCPRCGAEAWVNIDCWVCLACSQLLEGNVPAPHPRQIQGAMGLDWLHMF